MPFTLTMPKLSPTMEEGTIAKWHKKVGDYIDAGDLIMEVATDKATVEFNAIDAGYLRKIIVNEGGEAIVNQAIAVLSEQANESIEGYVPEGSVQAAPAPVAVKEEIKQPGVEAAIPQAAKTTTSFSQPVFTPEPPLEDYSFEFPRGQIEKRIPTSPLARKLAKEKKLDLTTVKGTGPGGRIMKSDLERAQPQGAVTFGHREQPKEVPGSYDVEPLTPIRKVIAQRLQEAKSFIPHFYVTQAIDAEPMVNLREQLRHLELSFTVNDLIVRATALALRKHPHVNSCFDTAKNAIVRYKTVDISIAVTLPTGLITPIVRHADFKNMGELSIEIRALAKRAKEGKLEPQEYKGGSFTISNLGMYGVTTFAAIINPPQAGILAVSGVQNVPVVKNGAVVPGKVMHLTLSADHRVIDGVAAAEFLKTVQLYLENPAGLLI